MHCLACSKPIEEGKGALFAEVFCCPDCFTVAERILERAEADLRNLRLMLRELIRQALLEGRLQFQPEPAGEVPRGTLLQQLLQVAQSRSCPVPPSTEPTQPAAPSADGCADPYCT